MYTMMIDTGDEQFTLTENNLSLLYFLRARDYKNAIAYFVYKDGIELDAWYEDEHDY